MAYLDHNVLNSVEAFLEALNSAYPGTCIGTMIWVDVYTWSTAGASWRVTYNLASGLAAYYASRYNESPSLGFRLERDSRGEWSAVIMPDYNTRWGLAVFPYKLRGEEVNG